MLILKTDEACSKVIGLPEEEAKDLLFKQGFQYYIEARDDTEFPKPPPAWGGIRLRVDKNQVTFAKNQR